MNCSPFFYRFNLITLLILSSVISISCVQKKDGDHTGIFKPSKTVAITKSEQSYPGSDELFKDVLLSDLAASQAEVKKHVLPHWSRIAERSRNVRQRMLPVFQDMGAPSGLQAVPVIESGYNPYALSYAGAMGLWQLMPRTARGLGVKSSKGQNGRRGIESSTRAAVGYLMKMEKRFGNWPLAFAAYHLGPTAVNRRLRKQPWQPSDGLNNMPVPSITRAYVRHVLGFAALLHMETVTFPEPHPTRAIKLMPPVDLTQLASVSGIDRKKLFILNPSLDQAQYLKHEITLHLPEKDAPALLLKLEEIGPKYVNIAIRSGDSLWSLARRHHTSTKHLRKLNPKLKSVLSIGKTVKVPANQLARAKPSPNPLLSQGRRIRYKVRSGDSLWVIAQRFGTTTRDIARSNQISQNRLIRPGDTLWIIARIRPS